MLSTEIPQKNFEINQTPKRPKKLPLNSIKKSTKKSTQLHSSNKKNNFYLKKTKKFQKKKIFKDDISLETNSTANTFEEENIITNNELNQYLTEIEFVIKDMCEKGCFTYENFSTNFFAKLNHSEGNVKNNSKNFSNLFNCILPEEKIKLILDIDETLVYSQVIQEIEKKNFSEKLNEFPEIQNINQDEYYIKINSDLNEKIFILKVKVRKGLTQFFKKLSPLCEFYINTMGSKSYVLQILKIFEKFYDVIIKKENVTCTDPERKKILGSMGGGTENFLILDDNICAWDLMYTPAIIPVKKFNDVNLMQDIFYQYYLFSNKIYCFNESKGYFINCINKIPHCVENINLEKNNNSQLFYITEIIIKSFLLKKIVNIPIRHCLHFIQNTILKNCKIFYQGNEQDFINEMIFLLGGTVINNLNEIKNATHIIYNKNIFNVDEIKDKNFIDVKWIFDCFFKFKKCDEKEREYKI